MIWCGDRHLRHQRNGFRRLMFGRACQSGKGRLDNAACEMVKKRGNTHPPPKAIRRYLFNYISKVVFPLVDPARAVERWSPNFADRRITQRSRRGSRNAQLLEECLRSDTLSQRPLRKNHAVEIRFALCLGLLALWRRALAGASIIGKGGADVPASAQTLRRRGP